MPRPSPLRGAMPGFIHLRGSWQARTPCYRLCTPGDSRGGRQRTTAAGGPEGRETAGFSSAPPQRWGPAPSRLSPGTAGPAAMATLRPPRPLFESARAPALFVPNGNSLPRACPAPCDQSAGPSLRLSGQSEQGLSPLPSSRHPPVRRTDGQSGWPMRRRTWLRLTQ